MHSASVSFVGIPDMYLGEVWRKTNGKSATNLGLFPYIAAQRKQTEDQRETFVLLSVNCITVLTKTTLKVVAAGIRISLPLWKDNPKCVERQPCIAEESTSKFQESTALFGTEDTIKAT